MKRVLMIVQNNFVNDSRIIKEANTLGKNGYEVKVLALYDKGLKEKEKFEFFEVERIYLTTRDKLSKKNIYLQSIKYVEFYKKCIKIAIDFSPDVVHCHDLMTLPMGNKIKKICGCKFIYDSHELWSHAAGNRRFSFLINKLKIVLERRIAVNCDIIITVCDSIANKLKEQFDLEKMPVVIRNIPFKNDNNVKENLFRKKSDIKKNEKIMLYQGAVEKGRGLENIIKAMPNIKSNVVLVVLGNGTLINKLKELAFKLKVDHRVFFHKAVSREILLNYTGSADIGISLIENYCLSYYYALPNKMFEFIQANLPVLCSDFPEMKKIVVDFGVGQVVDPENKIQISEVINEMILNKDKLEIYKKNCKNAKEILNWEYEEKILLKLYLNLLE